MRLASSLVLPQERPATATLGGEMRWLLRPRWRGQARIVASTEAVKRSGAVICGVGEGGRMQR
jgi:hypothetical protein